MKHANEDYLHGHFLIKPLFLSGQLRNAGIFQWRHPLNIISSTECKNTFEVAETVAGGGHDQPGADPTFAQGF